MGSDEHWGPHCSPSLARRQRVLRYLSAIPGPPGRLLPLGARPTRSLCNCPALSEGPKHEFLSSQGPWTRTQRDLKVPGRVGDRTEHLCPSLRPNPGLGWPAQLRGRQQGRPSPQGPPARVLTTTPRAQAPPDPGTGKSGAGDGWGRESVANPAGKGKVVPGVGEGQRADRWVRPSGRSGFLGPDFLGPRSRKGERKEPGKIPESWRLIVKCLETPQEVRQEERGRLAAVEPRFQAGRPTTWPLWLGSPQRRTLESAVGGHMSPPPSQEGPAAAQRLRPHPRGGEEAPICPSFWWSRGMCVADKPVGCAAPPAVTGHPHRALAPGSHPRPSPTLTLSKGSRPPHRKRLGLLSHPLPWRPAGSATMDGIPSPRHCPHSKGHQKPRGLLGAQVGPSVSVAPSLMPTGFYAAHRQLAAPPPQPPGLSPDSGLRPTPGGRSNEDLGSVLALPTRALASGPRCQLDQRWRVKYMSVQTPPPRTCAKGCRGCRLARPPPDPEEALKAGALLLYPFLLSQGPGVQKFQGPGRSRHMGSGTLLGRGDRVRKDPQGFLRVAPKWT